MKNFFDENIFLDNETSKILYSNVKDLPIFDYHCHLSPKEIAEDRVFHDLGELWLEGDHYKWRIMRAAGVDEEYVTGNAPSYEKFKKFASAVEFAAGNPVYHWIHFELKFYFGINTPLNGKTCDEIWNKTSDMMKDGSFSAKKLIKKSNVEAVFTTDDPADSLEYHKLIKESDFDVDVRPTYRPDAAVCSLDKPTFASYIEKLEKASNTKINDIEALTTSLVKRLDFFKENGCRCADISLSVLPQSIGSKSDADEALKCVLSGNKPTPKMVSDFTSYLFIFLSKEYKLRNITSQIHLSAMRNNNKKLFLSKGADVGNDSVGKPADLDIFASLLDSMAQNDGLPKTVVYTLNNANYYELATMIGNFWCENGGNLQLGAAWWFCDHRDGIKEQLKVAADTGILGRFNGMLTDSRSFTSYTRHDYFRRILCDYVGELVENGEYPMESAIELCKNVSLFNARKQFN